MKGVSKLPPNDSQKGNHYIVFKIDIPKNINANEKAIYEELSRVEYPIDPKTVRSSDDNDQTTSGDGKSGADPDQEGNSGSKDGWEQDTDKFYDLFKKMFRK